MLGYRLYSINSAGHIVDAREAELESDVDAIAWAEQHRQDSDLELWSGARIVAKLQRLVDRREGRFSGAM